MNKVLIDRELLSVASLHLEYSGYTETGKKLRALLDTPSGTPAMPVKAYYHEWTDLEGVRTRSVGLEVRKEFTDAPLVLESDALARIACLEGEIATRDETIARLVPPLNRAVQANYDLREELAACRVAVENCELFRARIAELEARIVWLECELQVNAAPVSDAKAQGVVQWPEADEIMQMAFEEGQPADDASGYCFELEEFDLFIERLISEVARLNAAPVQQVSAPDGFERYRLADKFCEQRLVTDDHVRAIVVDAFASGYGFGIAASPAAPAADAGLVEAFCKVEQALDLIGGIRHGKNVTQDELWQSCELLDAALAAHRAKGVV